MGLLKRRIIEAMEPREEPPMDSQWIPVEERLPDENEGVVVWDSANRIAAVAYRWVSDGESNYTMTAGDGYGFCEYAVTHWMPLPPEPPEVK